MCSLRRRISSRVLFTPGRQSVARHPIAKGLPPFWDSPIRQLDARRQQHLHQTHRFYTLIDAGQRLSALLHTLQELLVFLEETVEPIEVAASRQLFSVWLHQLLRLWPGRGDGVGSGAAVDHNLGLTGY